MVFCKSPQKGIAARRRASRWVRTSASRCSFRSSWGPVVEPGLRGPAVAAAVGVPEAAVHENHLPAGHEDEVGLAGRVPSVEQIAISEAEQEPPNGPFGSGVPTPHPLNDPGALLLSP